LVNRRILAGKSGLLEATGPAVPDELDPAPPEVEPPDCPTVPPEAAPCAAPPLLGEAPVAPVPPDGSDEGPTEPVQPASSATAVAPKKTFNLTIWGGFLIMRANANLQRRFTVEDGT
jgi:hypothetical protein